MPTEASIQRYIRRHVHKSSFSVFVACLPGLEHDTARELKRLLPGLVPTLANGGLSFEASISDIYRMNLGLGTADRVLLRLREFAAWTFPMLLEHARRVHWPAWVPDADELSFRITSRGSRLNMVKRIEETLHIAVKESFQASPGAVPGRKSTVYVRLHRDRVTLSLDTTGGHLHKRGDKQLTDVAPLRATLAAHAIRKVLERRPEVICDPFCGSGTILMEAMRESSGLPPGQNRLFAFMGHPYFREGAWRQVLREDAASRSPAQMKIVGGDNRSSAIATTKRNVRELVARDRAGADIEERDFRESLNIVLRMRKTGAIVTNPPYGIRLGDQCTTQRLQKAFADELSRLPSGWSFAIYTPFPSLYVDRDALVVEQVSELIAGGLRVCLLHGHVA